MIDEAFMPLREHIRRLVDIDGDVVDPELGVHFYIYEWQIDSPVEMDVVRDEGTLQLGSTPPLYYVDTSIKPVFHRMRVTVRRHKADHAG